MIDGVLSSTGFGLGLLPAQKLISVNYTLYPFRMLSAKDVIRLSNFDTRKNTFDIYVRPRQVSHLSFVLLVVQCQTNEYT